MTTKTKFTSEDRNKSLAGEWWEEFYPSSLINTIRGILFDYRTFFDEVFDEDWENKTNPIPFFFTSVAIFNVVGSLSLKEESPMQSDNPIVDFLAVNLILLYFILCWFVSHRFINKNYRTVKQTVHVYLYTVSIVLLLVYVPTLAILPYFDMMQPWQTTILLLWFFFIAINNRSIFKYTHDIGLLRRLWAGVKTNLVLITLGIPLLFISKD